MEFSAAVLWGLIVEDKCCSFSVKHWAVRQCGSIHQGLSAPSPRTLAQCSQIWALSAISWSYLRNHKAKVNWVENLKEQWHVSSRLEGEGRGLVQLSYSNHDFAIFQPDDLCWCVWPSESGFLLCKAGIMACASCLVGLSVTINQWLDMKHVVHLSTITLRY